MERKVAVIHTTVVTCDGINSRLKALVPDAEVMNIEMCIRDRDLPLAVPWPGHRQPDMAWYTF